MSRHDSQTQDRSGRDLAVCGRFDSSCERDANGCASAYPPVELGIGPVADPPRKLGNRTGKERTKIHRDHDKPFEDIVKSSMSYSLWGKSLHPVNMDKDLWPQRKNFKKRLDAYLKKTGKIQADAAKLLGIELSHLRNSLYRPEKRLSLEVLQEACKLFRCDITEFIDNPNEALPGMEEGDVAHMSPAKRLIVRSVAQKLSPDDVTDETAERVWKAIDSLIEAGKIRPPR